MLVLTGSVSHGKLHEAVEAGATGFVPTPFFNPSLGEQVTNLISLMPLAAGVDSDLEDFGFGEWRCTQRIELGVRELAEQGDRLAARASWRLITQQPST